MALPALLRDNLSIPVVGAPLFIVSNPDLVIEQCKAGIVGSFPALNARPKEMLEEWLKRITGELREYKAEASRRRRWRPSRSTRSCTAPTTACSTTSTSARNTRCRSRSPRCARPTTWSKSAKRYGCLVFHDVTNVTHAKRALQAGVDGLILVCAGAGGHAGRAVALRAGAGSAPVLRRLPCCSRAAIANGASVLAAQALGADLAYLGTRFIASQGSERDRRQQAVHHRIRAARRSSTPTSSPACTATT